MNGNNVPPGVIDLMSREFSVALTEHMQRTNTETTAMFATVRACMARAVQAAFPPEDDLSRRR